tara:strand:+ start:7796 stop:9649 length:1854 start_codon:yes stop_codon:yes gene_type:complete
LLFASLTLLVFWGREKMHRAGYHVLLLGLLTTWLGNKLLSATQLQHASAFVVFIGIGLLIWALCAPLLWLLERFLGRALLDADRWLEKPTRLVLGLYLIASASMALTNGIVKVVSLWNKNTSVLYWLKALGILDEKTTSFSISAGQLANTRVFSLLLLLTLFLLFGLYKRRWFHTLALGFFASTLFLLGLSMLPAFSERAVTSQPMMLLTTLTASVALLHWPRGTTQLYAEHEAPWITWYQSISGRVLTHVLLICFTMITLYPVLLVFKKAVVPTQSFDLELSPIPSTLTKYLGALQSGKAKQRACYSRAMRQNFNEVMGLGDACLDLLCQQYRNSGQQAWLSQNKICEGFVGVIHAKGKAKKQAFQKWKQTVLSGLPQTLSTPKMTKLLREMEEQQTERGKRRGVFFQQLWNSVFVSFITTILGIFLACTAAYAFSRFDFVGRETGLMSFLVSQMFPGTLMMIPLYILIAKLGLLNSLWGLTLVYSTTSIPFCVWMLKGYFDTIPKEIEEAAIIDGASRTMIFVRIILPLSKPAIAVTALFSFMTAWNEFILAATFMNQESSYTLPVLLQSYVGAHTTDWGHFAAGAILVSLPIVALFYVLQKYLVSGLTAGSVKG